MHNYNNAPHNIHYIFCGITGIPLYALAPKYLSDCVSTVSTESGRYRLRSTGSEAYILPRTRTRFGEHGFFYSGPSAWNTLPSDLHDITDTSTFRKRLKNVLFDRAFNWFCWRSWTCRKAAPYKFCVDWLIDPICITSSGQWLSSFLLFTSYAIQCQEM